MKLSRDGTPQRAPEPVAALLGEDAFPRYPFPLPSPCSDTSVRGLWRTFSKALWLHSPNATLWRHQLKGLDLVEYDDGQLVLLVWTYALSKKAKRALCEDGSDLFAHLAARVLNLKGAEHIAVQFRVAHDATPIGPEGYQTGAAFRAVSEMVEHAAKRGLLRVRLVLWRIATDRPTDADLQACESAVRALALSDPEAVVSGRLCAGGGAPVNDDPGPVPQVLRDVQVLQVANLLAYHVADMTAVAALDAMLDMPSTTLQELVIGPLAQLDERSVAHVDLEALRRRISLESQGQSAPSINACVRSGAASPQRPNAHHLRAARLTMATHHFRYSVNNMATHKFPIGAEIVAPAHGAQVVRVIAHYLHHYVVEFPDESLPEEQLPLDFVNATYIRAPDGEFDRQFKKYEQRVLVKPNVDPGDVEPQD